MNTEGRIELKIERNNRHGERGAGQRWGGALLSQRPCTLEKKKTSPNFLDSPIHHFKGLSSLIHFSLSLLQTQQSQLVEGDSLLPTTPTRRQIAFFPRERERSLNKTIPPQQPCHTLSDGNTEDDTSSRTVQKEVT